ncbi:YcxB family protein [Streptomyces sp. GbtcB6]|uniref:YcxB family protein n=1 Tax=Streptomyces sp. GbtcB6 TaxID=2824751 RepID=UPI001C307DBD|nr:YcxB family protein [Streptomyces sp. GbtcB6]
MMQPTLTLRYVPEADDILELMTRVVVRRRLRRRALGQAVVVLVTLWGLLVLLAVAAPAWQWWIPALLLAVVLVRYVVREFAVTTRWSLRRRARAIGRRSPRTRLAHEMEIGPDALTIRVEGQTTAYAWSHFGSFTESDRQFVLLDRTGRASEIVPKRGLSDAALVPVCRDLLTQYLEDPTAPPAPSASPDGHSG